MVLSVKSVEADRLARKLAETTGETITEAVVTSLRERLEREERKRRQDQEERMLKIKAISEHFVSLPVLDDRPFDELLGYSDHGYCE